MEARHATLKGYIASDIFWSHYIFEYAACDAICIALARKLTWVFFCGGRSRMIIKRIFGEIMQIELGSRICFLTNMANRNIFSIIFSRDFVFTFLPFRASALQTFMFILF